MNQAIRILEELLYNLSDIEEYNHYSEKFWGNHLSEAVASPEKSKIVYHPDGTREVMDFHSNELLMRESFMLSSRANIILSLHTFLDTSLVRICDNTKAQLRPEIDLNVSDMGTSLNQKYKYMFKVLPFEERRYEKFIGVFNQYTKLRNAIAHEGNLNALNEKLLNYFVKKELIEDEPLSLKKEIITYYITKIRNFIQEIISDLESRSSKLK